MGTMQHKYTQEYFTGMREDGSSVGYGAEGYAQYAEGGIRKQDFDILRRLNFNGQRVLEFGFGRGESIKYIIEHGASHYEGVDFSPNAHVLARKLLDRYDLPVPKLHEEDAILFIENFLKEIDSENDKFDIVLMLDFIEHVPRGELRPLMILLRKLLHSSSVVVINTPAYLYDNDIFCEDINFLNEDGADVLAQTSGMHCNKFTLATLHLFMQQCGYLNISEAHYFLVAADPNFVFLDSYYDSWFDAKKTGSPILDYADDVIEALPDTRHVTPPPVHMFSEGRMLGVCLHIKEEYKQYFSQGSYDEAIFSYLDTLTSSLRVIFDLGGFMGVSSLLFSRLVLPDGKVYCFEPNPYNINRIRKNISLNAEERSKIILLPYAIGDQDSESTMLLSSDIDSGFSSTSQLLNSHCTYTQEYLKSINFFEQKVSTIKLDSFVSQTGIVPDMIKVDIEGAEHLFFEGAIETIKKYKPLIFLELHSPFCAMKCTQVLEKLGYGLCILNEEEDRRIMIVCSPLTEAISQAFPFNFSISKYEECHINFGRYKRLVNFQDTKIQGLNHLVYELTQNVDTVQSVLASTESGLAHTQAELAHTQAELANTQAELVHAQAELIHTQAELAQALRILDHPVVRLQRKVWQALKFWK